MLMLMIIACFNVYAEETVTWIKKYRENNKQQFDIKDSSAEELILENQNLEITNINITGEGLKNSNEQIIIMQQNNASLKEELSKGLNNTNQYLPHNSWCAFSWYRWNFSIILKENFYGIIYIWWIYDVFYIAFCNNRSLCYLREILLFYL